MHENPVSGRYRQPGAKGLRKKTDQAERKEEGANLAQRGPLPSPPPPPGVAGPMLTEGGGSQGRIASAEQAREGENQLVQERRGDGLTFQVKRHTLLAPQKEVLLQ